VKQTAYASPQKERHPYSESVIDELVRDVAKLEIQIFISGVVFKTRKLFTQINTTDNQVQAPEVRDPIPANMLTIAVTTRKK